MLVRTQQLSSLGGGRGVVFPNAYVYVCMHVFMFYGMKLCYLIFVYGFENLIKIN